MAVDAAAVALLASHECIHSRAFKAEANMPPLQSNSLCSRTGSSAAGARLAITVGHGQSQTVAVGAAQRQTVAVSGYENALFKTTLTF